MKFFCGDSSRMNAIVKAAASLSTAALVLTGCSSISELAQQAPVSTTTITVTEEAIPPAPAEVDPSASADSPVAPAPAPDTTDAPESNQAAAMRALLAGLEVKGRAPKTGYARDQFGENWKDIDRNGCDQRNDVLARDLHNAEAPKGCKVLSGVLDDPYTGTTINFVRGQDTSVLVQIDHVVALADAWQKGAQQLSPERREQFANDPLNLLAVDGPANQQKGAGDAATWLPANKAFRCQYVSIQIQVKAEYQLWVTPAERDAMDRELNRC